MKGYVRDYTNLLRKHGYKEDEVKRYAQQVMQSHTPEQLPVLNGLAKHYAVCDMWFSSIPSQTNTNRAFAFCGTSMGLTDNGFLEEDKRAPVIEKIVGYKLGDDRFKAKTIFNALADDGKTTWKVFRESGMLQSNIDKMAEILLRVINVFMAKNPLLLPAGITADILLAYLIELSSSKLESDYIHRLFPEILKIKDADSHFGKLDDFHTAARAGQLPNFTFIEPEWTIGERGTGEGKLMQKALFHQGDDYHPPGNTDAGENLVKQVYMSLIANKAAWEKTLLIITFDEPVGSFDHIPPPAAIPPWGEGEEPSFKREHDFKFNRYGGRVPAILVSPWVEKGTVFRSTTNVPFDHTSLIATILKWRGLENRIADFGERTKHAPTFENIVSLSTPRTDRKDVPFLKLAHKAGEPVRFYDRFYLRAANGKYISRFQEHAVLPFSIFSDDSAMSEYFPTLAYEPVDRYTGIATATQFYFQNADNRPDSGEVKMGTKIRLNACEDGLGSYNVLGAWKDSHDCYYFNDYMEGDNCKKQTWILQAVKQTGSLYFGDQVSIQNEYFKQRLAPDSRDRGYVTTNTSEAYWTVEPISDELELAWWHGGIRGVLLVGKFRTQQQLNGMSADDQRNTLITELGGRTKDTVSYYQSLNDADLAGTGALLVYLRETGSRTDQQIKTMSADDMRNTVIVEVGAQTGRGDLQALSNMNVVKLVFEPGADTFRRGDEFYLKHLATGRYVTGTHKGVQWYPTLGDSAARVKLKIPVDKSAQLDHNSMPIVDGTSLEIVSTEDLVDHGKRCDVLMAWTNPNLYYYYGDYRSPEYRTWIVSLVGGSGLVKSGSHVRLINKGYDNDGRKQFMAPDGSYLTTVSEDTKDCIWVLEKTSK